VQTLARWLAGEDAPAGLALRSEIDGERLALDFFYDEAWNTRIAQTSPQALVAETSAGSAAVNVRPIVWEKIEPGRFRATVDLSAGKMIRGAVRVGNTAIPFGPLTVSSSAEWSFDRERLLELRQLSMRSGGQERLDLAQIWSAPRPVAWRSIRAWILALWAVLFATDALLTRIGVGGEKRERDVRTPRRPPRAQRNVPQDLATRDSA
jgi:hypothetical protein